jgi:hypothetical protein
MKLGLGPSTHDFRSDDAERTVVAVYFFGLVDDVQLLWPMGSLLSSDQQ